MSKKRIILTSIITTFTTLVCVWSVFVVVVLNSVTPLYSNLEVRDDKTLYTDKEDIKILQLSDLQFSTFTAAAIAFNSARKVINKAKPDLIVLTGDNLTLVADKTHVQLLINFMDGFKIPWAVVYGNHDYDTIVSVERQSELYENSEYSIFKKGNIKESAGNYYYNLKRNEEFVYSLIFMNSHKKGFIEEQVVWYENVINEVKSENNGNIIPSMIFFHIPLIETKMAYNEYIKDPSIGEGKHYENIAHQETNVGMFDKIKQLNSTKLLAYGHDHKNYTSIKYEEVIFSYGLKTGRTSYHSKKIQGGVVYTIDRNNDINIERIFI